MASLRWRIASWYALLLIIVIVALGVAVTLRFQQILLGQAREHVATTMLDIERATLPPQNAFSLGEIGDPLQALESPDNLERWSSTTTFLQVDDIRGHVLAKSFNMGDDNFPQPPTLTALKRTATQTVTVAGIPFLVQSDLLINGADAAVVQVGEPLDAVNRAFAQTERAIALILTIAIVAVAILSLALASQATNPINELARAMREIGSDRLNRRVRWKGRRDEIGRLAATFDDLLARLEESFARERQFISDASHELKTPLTSINANAQMLARWGDRDESVRRESLATIVHESSSLAAMVTGMLTLAKADSGDAIPKEPVSLKPIGEEVAASALPRATEKGLTIAFHSDGSPALVMGDPSLLRQLLSNLVDNAIKFTERGGVEIDLSEDRETVKIEVRDTGPGIDPAELPFVFDRFYRADKSRTRTIPGTGLGLAIVRSIARVHDGSVSARSRPGGGTTFVARFPAVSTVQA